MGRVAVVGSGPTGIGAAEILVDAGFGVDLIDPADEALDPRATPNRTLSGHATPDEEERWPQRLLQAFHGELAATLLRKRIFRSNFVFEGVEHAIPLEGPWLPRSLARGGLANVWGAGCYPLRDEDYADWPVEPEQLRRWFGPATRLLHVSGSRDALSHVYREHEGMTELGPGDGFDPTSPFEAVLGAWRQSEAALAAGGLHAGRARLAVRARQSAGPGACEACGQCLEGCPVEAIWNGRAALQGLIGRGTRYLPGNLVRRWSSEPVGLWLECGAPEQPAMRLGPYDALFLAAGPLSSFRIAAQSVPGALPASARLAENDVTVLPFVFRNGLRHVERRFTLSEAAVAIDPAGPLERPAHLQLYRPGGASLGPVSRALDVLPSRLRSLALRGIERMAVGMLYLHGSQSRGLRLCLMHGEAPVATVQATPEDGDPGREAARASIRRLAAHRRQLGLSPLAFALRRGGPGFSAHLGCVLPIRRRPERLECHPDGRLAGVVQGAPVFVVDLSALPAMPAQNPTLTGVANAMRVAAQFAAVGR